VDRVTFFAYAPYVAVEPTTGKLSQTDISVGKDKWGITGMTRNTAAGDPIIKYIASFKTAEAVDLCWGVCNQSDWAKVQEGTAQTFEIGKPWFNVERPANINQKLKFTFKHALAKMQIQVNEFNDSYVSSTDMPTQTRIWIRSVRFKGFTMKGALNLNNETPNKPYWMNYNGIGDLEADDEVVIYDGRKDGKEGVTGSVATNEKTLGLNTQFIETEASYGSGVWNATPAGVNKDLTNLFNESGIFYVIPTDDNMEVEIVYDVETIDANLGTKLSDGKTAGSHIENRISKSIKFGDDITKLEAGKAYTIKLHLGMNSVKFDAAVTDWEDMAAPDIDLPANMPAYEAKSTTGKLEIPGADTQFTFAVYGLKGGENVTADVSAIASATAKVNSTGDFSTPDNRANASGVVYVQVSSFDKNNTIKDLAAKAITVTGAQTSATTINVTQKAQPMTLVGKATTSDRITYTLRSNLTGSEGDLAAVKGTVAAATDIKVWYDGAAMAVVGAGDTPNEAQVSFDWSAGTLKFATTRDAAKIIKVYLKAGDVPAETVSFMGDGTALPIIP
jgi:hypothetical protein